MDAVLRIILLILLVAIGVIFTPIYAYFYAKKSHYIENLIRKELPVLQHKIMRIRFGNIPFVGDHLKITAIFREHHFHANIFPSDLERYLYDIRKFVTFSTIIYLFLIICYLIIMLIPIS